MLKTTTCKYIIICLFISHFCSAQQKYTTYRGLTGKAMEYELVSKEHLDDDFQNPFYLPPDGSGILKPGIVLKKTGLAKKIIKQEQVIKGYNGTTILENFDKVLYMSDNLHYFGRETIINLPTKDENGVTLVEFFDKNGEKYFEKKMPITYEEDGWTFYVSNSGDILEVYYWRGIIKIYNPDGTLRAEKDFFHVEDYREGRGFQVEFSGNGKYIALNAVNFTEDFKAFNVTAILVDFDLNVLFERRLDYGYAISISANDDASLLVVCCAEYFPKRKIKSYIFNREKNEMVVLDNIAAQTKEVQFYDNIIILGSQRSILFYDHAKDTTLFQYNLFNNHILRYDYAPEKELLFLLEGMYIGGETQGIANVRVIVYNLNRVPAYELKIGTVKDTYFPSLTCSKDASLFMLQVSRDIYMYQAVQ